MNCDDYSQPLASVLPVLRASLGVSSETDQQNGSAVAAAARDFNVVPAVFHAAQRGDLDVPEDLLALLQPDMRTITQNNLVLAMELQRLAARLEAADVPYLTFKGAANAVTLYGDLSHRRCGDIDLIVPVEAFEKTQDILLSSGFDFVKRYENSLQASFRHQRSLASIDLHWGIPPRALELKPEPLWTCRERITMLNGEVDSLNLEGILIMLAINCSKEPWDVSLHQAYDLAWLLVYPSRAIDWPRVQRISRLIGASRLVNSGLSLVGELFQLPPQSCPSYLVKHFREKKQVLTELKHAVEQVEVNTDVSIPSPVAFRRWTQYYDAVHATELLRQWRTLRRIFTVTDADRQWLPLPAGLDWLYLFLRPIRLIVQRLSMAGRSH